MLRVSFVFLLFVILGNEAEPQSLSVSKTNQALNASFTFSPRAKEQRSPPSSPTSGNKLPVLGSFAGAGSGGVATAVCAGGGSTMMSAISASTVSWGGGGIWPVLLTCRVITSSGTSVT